MKAIHDLGGIHGFGPIKMDSAQFHERWEQEVFVINKIIQEGNSEEEIYSYLKNKYGQWIVYDTEINKKTVYLWLFPVILFVFGGILIIRKVFIN